SLIRSIAIHDGSLVPGCLSYELVKYRLLLRFVIGPEGVPRFCAVLHDDQADEIDEVCLRIAFHIQVDAYRTAGEFRFPKYVSPLVAQRQRLQSVGSAVWTAPCSLPLTSGPEGMSELSDGEDAFPAIAPDL